MKRLFFASFIMLAGCATGPRYAPAPAAPTDHATIYLFRESVRNGIFLGTPFKVDGQKVVSLRNGGYSWVQVPAGTHTIDADMSVHLSLKVPVVPGKEYYVGFTQEHPRSRLIREVLKVVEPEKAREQLKDYRYTASTR